MSTKPFDVEACRAQFPALQRRANGQPLVYLDGPAGSQVPQRVVDAISNYLINTNANHGGVFGSSVESDAMLHQAHQAAADLLGADDPNCVAFGQNMTSLTFAFSRSVARTWKPGDEIIVTRLDHDANISPWVLAARDAGATVHHLDFHLHDCTLDLAQYDRLLSKRTRWVAVGCASNAVGTVNPVRTMIERAHAAGAKVFLDAVHYAPHALIDVKQWDCDALACSSYKFFGPHIGLLWGKRQLLEELPAYKLRPAPDDLPGRWMTGTQSHEGIAGVLACIDYLADLGSRLQPAARTRRAGLMAAFHAIQEYEQKLATLLLDGLSRLPKVKVHGIREKERLAERVPTVAITVTGHTSESVARYLAQRGIYVWNGNFYAQTLVETLGLGSDGLVRLGLLHYNTSAEVERLLTALGEL